MKGKNGKPSAMRGGGIARKGVGMALKGGGVARKGTGSGSTPGGKVAKMAMGGNTSAKALPPRLGGSMNPPSDTPMGGPKGSMIPNRSLAGYAAANYGGPRGNPGMVRPGFPAGGPRPALSGPGQIARPAGASMPTASQLGSGLGAVGGIGGVPQGTDQQAAAQRAMEASMKKNGGKVARYAKGGAVKMTAGAGSGSGRLEKVAAHKAAKRIPATGLKKGGKVKGK